MCDVLPGPGASSVGHAKARRFGGDGPGPTQATWTTWPSCWRVTVVLWRQAVLLLYLREAVLLLFSWHLRE